MQHKRTSQLKKLLPPLCRQLINYNTWQVNSINTNMKKWPGTALVLAKGRGSNNHLQWRSVITEETYNTGAKQLMETEIRPDKLGADGPMQVCLSN